MSVGVTNKKQCILCDKTGSILTCSGCQQSFCGSHAFEHRHDLSDQLDDIMQEHNLLQEELQDPLLFSRNPLLKRVDHWEKKSIAKIQAAARSIRKKLEESFQQSKEQASEVCDDIGKTLRSAREAAHVSENEIIRLEKQLKDLKSELTSPSSPKLILDKSSSIFFLSLETAYSSNNPFTTKKRPPTNILSSNLDSQERFLETLGPLIIEDDGYLARHDDFSLAKAYVCGRFCYKKGCHIIRFKLEKCRQPYCIFFGCISSEKPLTRNVYKSVDAVGWFQCNQVYEHGRCNDNCKKYGYNSTDIKTADELCLILDCDNDEIRLFHERLDKIWRLSVNTSLIPLPWKFLMVLENPRDTVRILSSL